MTLTEPDVEQIAESVPHIVWMASADGATTYFNRRGTQYTGCPAETNYDWNWVTLVHPDDAGRAREAWERATQVGVEYMEEYRIRRFDGSYRWHSFRALPVRDSRGRVSTWIGTATDIEDEKQLELSLRRSKRELSEMVTLLQSIEAATPVGFKLIDHQFRVVRINETLAEVSGSTVEDALGRPVADLVPDLWPDLEGIYRRALSGESVLNVEMSTPSKEEPGHSRYWLASYYPVRIDGEIFGAGNTVIDITKRKQAEAAREANLAAMIKTIAATVEYRDPYTAGHQRVVAQIAAAIATELGLDDDTTKGIETAAGIHDLGKIAVPAEILSKPARLEPVEYELVKRHAEIGYQIIASIDFPWPVAEMVRQHHERMNGSGYPRGLTGSQISLGARIIAVADVVEAMASHRPFRAALGIEAAMTQIQLDRGSLLDGDAVDACMRLHAEGRLRDLAQS